uniref:C-type lectin n=1 Tax=Acrobeloides nanus TaxID=290746 RepID=A0A914EMY7_9BILA
MFLLTLLGFVVLASGNVLRNHKFGDILVGSNDIATPCSTNISNTWVNIFLMIDVSTNMGAANLRQLALSLSSEFTQLSIATNSCQPHTNQIAVITYSDTANIVANLTQIQSHQDLANTLLSLKISNSNSAFGISNAFNLAEKAWNDFDSFCRSDFSMTDRLGVFVFAGANVNVNAFIDNLRVHVLPWDSIITINANPKDALLTQVFNNISSPSFNLSMADKNLYQDFTWAITQANCECSIFDIFTQITAFNTTANKWQKYADCFQLTGFGGFHDPDNSICFELSGSTDAVITSTVKENVVRQMLGYQSNEMPFYLIGLHRNAQKKWVWTDYDGSEVPLGNYAPWAPGYNENSPGDCVAVVYQSGVDLSKNWLWAPISCQNQTSGCDGSDADCVNVICQTRACDADHASCSGELPRSISLPGQKRMRMTRQEKIKYSKASKGKKNRVLKKNKKL